MKSFYQFYVEITDVLSASTDDITFDKDPYVHSFDYSFKIPYTKENGTKGEVNYAISFEKCKISIDFEIITNDAYSISLSSDLNGYQPTRLGNGPTVYRHLIKAVKKFIEQENPEGFYFYGAEPEQDIMYNAFYEKMLIKYYTKIDSRNYIRNDLLKQWEITGDERFNLIKQSMDELQTHNPVERYKKEKEEKRKKFLNIKNSIGNSIGKIMWNTWNNSPIYIKKVINLNQVAVISIRYGREMNDTVNIDYIKNLTNNQKNSSAVEELSELITKKYFKRPEIAIEM